MEKTLKDAAFLIREAQKTITDLNDSRYGQLDEVFYSLMDLIEENRDNVPTVLTMPEKIALGEYLSEWPEHMTFDEVVNSVDNESISHIEGVEPCEFFEDWHPSALMVRIVALKETLEAYGL